MSDHAYQAMLAPFEGLGVVKSKIEIPGAAGGLMDALDIDPIEIRPHQEVTIVMRVRCTKVAFETVKDTDDLVRVHSFKPIAGETAIAKDAFETAANLYVRGHADRVREERDRRSGQGNLTLVTDDEDKPDEPFGHEPEVDNRDGHADEWTDGE